MVPCLETGLALVWSVRMTSEDPIPLDQDPTQSWIGVAHSGGLCTLDMSGIICIWGGGAGVKKEKPVRCKIPPERPISPIRPSLTSGQGSDWLYPRMTLWCRTVLHSVCRHVPNPVGNVRNIAHPLDQGSHKLFHFSLFHVVLNAASRTRPCTPPHLKHRGGRGALAGFNGIYGRPHRPYDLKKWQGTRRSGRYFEVGQTRSRHWAQAVHFHTTYEHRSW